MKNLIMTGSAAAFLSLSLILAPGCGSKVQEVDMGETTSDTMTNETRANIQLIRVNIPSPHEMTGELQKAGFNFNKSLMTTSGRASGYTTNIKSAMNLGVFGADLGYASAYNQNQEVLEYLSGISQLAKAVGVGNAFDPQLLERFKNNLGKKDSLMELINTAYEKAEKHLRSNQRVSTTALIIAGGWIEGLYIATQTASAQPPGEKTFAVYRRIWSHVYSFKYVMELLGEFKNNADCAKVLADLKDMEQFTYNAGRSADLTQADINAIKEKITAIRNQVIS